MSDSNKNKYPALETVIGFYYFLGVLAIIGGIVGILVAVSMEGDIKVLIIIPSIIFGVFGAIFNFAQAEMLSLFIDIANNTEAIRVNTTMTSTIMNKGGKDLFEKALKTKDTTEKKILREEIAEKYPETEYGYFSKAWLVSLRGCNQEAVRLYTKAIEIDPNFADAYFNRGLAYADMQNYTQAIKDYTKAIEINPDYAEAYYNRGNTYAQIKEHSLAISDLTKAIEINPNYAEAYNNRGNTYFDIKEYFKSISDYTKAIEIDPNDAFAYYNRGLAYAETDNFSQACSDWQKAYQLGHKPALELIKKHCK